MEFIQPPSAPAPPAPDIRQPQPYSRSEVELKDGICAIRTQKAGREKLRRDRVNEQFVELGNVVDPSRPKNDRATIIVDAIQLLKDLTSQINKLKGEHATLTEESRELMQEKMISMERRWLLSLILKTLMSSISRDSGQCSHGLLWIKLLLWPRHLINFQCQCLQGQFQCIHPCSLTPSLGIRILGSFLTPAQLLFHM